MYSYYIYIGELTLSEQFKSLFTCYLSTSLNEYYMNKTNIKWIKLTDKICVVLYLNGSKLLLSDNQLLRYGFRVEETRQDLTRIKST